MGKPKWKRGAKGEGKRRCIFCGSAEIDSEHVFPGWLTELTNGVLALRGELDEQWITARAGKQRRSWALDTTARFVCEDCNSGWMSTLERESKAVLTPMILGQQRVHDLSGDKIHRVTLSPAAQLTVAKWAFKTAITVDVSMPERKFAPEVASTFFKAGITPPNNCMVYVAAYGDTHMICGSMHRRTVIKLANFHTSDGVFIPPDAPIERPGVVVTLLLLRLVIQVLWFEPRGFRVDHTVNDGDRRTHRVWPVAPTGVVWPPNNFFFHDQQIARFIERSATIIGPD